MLDTVFSINPNDDISIEVDEELFEMYDSSMKKNGRINAFNELKSFSKHLLEERKKAYDKVIKSEKWFKKKLEFLDEFETPYRVGDASKTDLNKINDLVESIPDLYGDFDSLDEREILGNLSLVSMIDFIHSNKNFFEKVDSVSLSENGKELYDLILQFDYINVMYERSRDLIKLLVNRQFNKSINRKEFVRSPEEVKKEKTVKPGPDVPPNLLRDIRDILEIILDPDETLFIEDADIQEEDLYKKNGDLNIKKLVEDYIPYYQYFSKKWMGEDAIEREGGYSDRSLKEYFSQEYKKMKSSNSS